jgi:hypothetical protein
MQLAIDGPGGAATGTLTAAANGDPACPRQRRSEDNRRTEIRRCGPGRHGDGGRHRQPRWHRNGVAVLDGRQNLFLIGEDHVEPDDAYVPRRT